MNPVLRGAGITCVVMACSIAGPVAAQGGKAAGAEYPTRPVRLVVPFPPGASNDIIARLIGQKLTEAMGQQIVVDNRPGAGGSLGADTVAKAAADGHTLLLANPGPNVNNPLMRRDNPYKAGDFTPVIFIGYAPLIIVANPGFPPNSAKELVDYARRNPGKVNWGSSGNGSSLHIGLALFQAATGANVTHVPYKGAAPALTDVVSGQINLMYTTSVTGAAHIKAGRVKILGNAGPRRQEVLPDVPTLAEQGIKNAEATVWFGVAGPAGMPRGVVDRLNREVNGALGMPDIRSRLDRLGLVVGGGTTGHFDAFIQSEMRKLAGLIKTGAVQLQ